MLKDIILYKNTLPIMIAYFLFNVYGLNKLFFVF